MKKCVVTVLLIMCLSLAASAANISVITVGDRDGYSGAGGGVVANNTAMFYIGDPHPALSYFDYGVVKYNLPAELAGQTIVNATVNIRIIQHGPGQDGYVHVLLQKYTYDNTTAVNSTDCTTTAVQNIGVYSATAGEFMSWNVTSTLQSDVNNGYDYSAYRAAAVVSPTDLTPVAIPGAYYVNCAAAELTGTYPTWTGLEPRLDVEYVPEPATMCLLALGSLLLARRK